MAGMFYSIKEVAEKLGKSEEDVRQLVKAGRLREFRDGPNLLFKVDEVTSLMSDTTAVGKKAEVKPEESKPAEASAEEILLEPEAPPEAPPKEEEIILTDADTQIVEEGIKVLGETDAAAALKDTGAGDETFKGLTGTPAPGKEASLEEIEKDVSLDTFGSGSGLLDLSLQADDTSLGGILDEIYTTGGDAKPTGDVAEAAAEGAGTESSAAPVEESAGAHGSAMEVAAEADQMEARFPEPTIAMPTAMAKAYAEPEPDALSNAMGVMLFIPLIAVIYASIVSIAWVSNIMPAALKGIQGFIWYVAIGMAVASLAILGVGASMGRERVPKAPKPPKIKKEKPPKPVKEKKK